MVICDYQWLSMVLRLSMVINGCGYLCYPWVCVVYPWLFVIYPWLSIGYPWLTIHG